MKMISSFVIALLALVCASSENSLGQKYAGGVIQSDAQKKQSSESAKLTPAQRLAKNRRYNGGRCDLAGELECVEQFEPRALQLIPLESDTLVFSGEVRAIDAYFSEDRTHIYRENVVEVQEVFKGGELSKLNPQDYLILDQIGGSKELDNGRLLRDYTRSGFLGKLLISSRYLFFVRPIHNSEGLAIVTAYELWNGKVLVITEDGTSGHQPVIGIPSSPRTSTDEQRLFQAVRERIAQFKP